MHKGKRLLSAGLVAGALAASMVLGIGTPAQAVNFPGYDLWQSMLTIKSSQLQNANGPAAQAAWSHQAAKNAAGNAGLFSAQEIYGNVAREHVAEVIPLDQPKDYAPGSGGKIKPDGTAKGPRIPRFNAASLGKAVTGPVGGTVALTAFMFRGDIAGGALDLIGMDAQNAVCTNDVARQGFVNFITGQDCDAWQAAQDFVPNVDVEAGVSGGIICATSHPGSCIQLYKQYRSNFTNGTGYTAWCHGTSNGGTGAPTPEFKTKSGRIFSGTYSNGWVKYSNPACIPHAAGYGASIYTWSDANPTQIDPIIAYGFLLGRTGEKTTPVIVESGDPVRSWTCSVTGNDGFQYSGTSEGFKESMKAFPAPDCPTLPPGVMPMEAEIIQNTPNKPPQSVWKQEATEEAKKYDAEFGAICEQQTCLLDLVTTNDGLSCFGKDEACADWMTDPDRDTKYECRYGNKKQHVSECYAYAQIFNLQNRLAGAAYSDPATGEQIKSGGTSRSIDQMMMGRGAIAADGTRDCFGGGWAAANPLEWVLKPLQCAAEWAFAPRLSTVLGVTQSVEAAWENKAPTKIAAMVTGWRLSPVATGCKIPVTFLGVTFDLANACPGEPLAGLATTSRWIINISFTVGLVLAVSRYVGKSVDYEGL